MADFQEIIARRKPSVDKALISKYEEWASKFGAI